MEFLTDDKETLLHLEYNESIMKIEFLLLICALLI